MLFNSFEFLIFLTAFLSIFFAVPLPTRRIVLLVGSYLFYAAWRPSFVVLLMFTTLVDYVGARIIDGGYSAAVRRAALTVSLAINLGLLATFKYLDFFINAATGAVGFLGFETHAWAMNLILPVGISFYTFQSVGYTLDVYSKRIPAEKNIITYAIYVSFFPQLVAGPIERAAHMLVQYRSPRQTSPNRIATGLWLIGYGLFKKMCIADLLAPFVNGVYANPTAFSATYTLSATVLFALQIYCDFSGYSDIAIGTARILGYDLLTNFRQPYFSTSLSDFWRRWHIALSSWFRDFVYIPLGGSKVALPKWTRNVLVVFVLSGLWHGANWTFLLWGFIHGVGLVVERFFVLVSAVGAPRHAIGAAPSPRKPLAVVALNVLGFAATISTVVLAWVMFRANSIADATHILSSWASLSFPPLDYGTFKILGLASFEIALGAVHIVVLLLLDALICFRPSLLQWARRKPALSTMGAVALIYDIALFGVFGRVDFIYFQF